MAVGFGVYRFNQSRKAAGDVQLKYIRAISGDPAAGALMADLASNHSNTIWGRFAALDMMLVDLIQGKREKAEDMLKALEGAKNEIVKSVYHSYASTFKLDRGDVEGGLEELNRGAKATGYRTFRDMFMYRKALVLYLEGEYEKAGEILKGMSEDYESSYREDAEALLRKVNLLKGGE